MNEWKKELEVKYFYVIICIGYFGVVIGMYLGEGVLGFGWYMK